MATVEQAAKSKKIAMWTKLGIVALVGLIVSPIIMSIIQGIVGLAVAAFLGLTAVQLAPWVGMKVANWKIKLIVAEASANPIETMRNILIEKTEIIQEKDIKIVDFESKIGDYHYKMVGFAKRYPEEAAQYQAVEAKMNAALASMKKRQLEAKKLQKAYNDEIIKAEAIYAMATAASSVTELSADIQGKLYMDIKEKVSFDAVNHSFNSAVAALSLEVDNDSAYDTTIVSTVPALEAPNSANVLTLPLKNKENVR